MLVSTGDQHPLLAQGEPKGTKLKFSDLLPVGSEPKRPHQAGHEWVRRLAVNYNLTIFIIGSEVAILRQVDS